MVFTIDGRETENASEIYGLVAVVDVTTAEPDSSKTERGGGEGGEGRREKLVLRLTCLVASKA